MLQIDWKHCGKTTQLPMRCEGCSIINRCSGGGGGGVPLFTDADQRTRFHTTSIVRCRKVKVASELTVICGSLTSTAGAMIVAFGEVCRQLEAWRFASSHLSWASSWSPWKGSKETTATTKKLVNKRFRHTGCHFRLAGFFSLSIPWLVLLEVMMSIM